MIAEPVLKITDFAIGANENKIKTNSRFQNVAPPEFVGIVKKYAIGGKFQKKPNLKDF